MAICKRCGADDLHKSDLCGNAGCVHCCGTPIDEIEDLLTGFIKIPKDKGNDKNKKKSINRK